MLSGLNQSSQSSRILAYPHQPRQDKIVNQHGTKPGRLAQLASRLWLFVTRSIFQKQTWLLIGDWMVWHLLPHRRPIQKLVNQLIPLQRSTPPDRVRFRNRIFTLTCLKIRPPDRLRLVELLNQAHEPTGLEQAFLSAIFPPIVNRGLGTVVFPSTERSHLNVEIGYLAHNEDYFFWQLDIDGERRDDPNRKTIVPELEVRGDKRYPSYPLGVARLAEGIEVKQVTTGNLDPLAWIVKSQTHFNQVLLALKKRNYKVTTVERPRFELGRLRLLRRLDLEELKKHQSRSAHQSRR